jgi:hypothetical protein
MRGFMVVCVLLLLAACGQPSPLKIDQQLMTTETSPIPGAQAKVFGAPSSNTSTPAADYCVTDAGYCPLAAVAQAGRNCICQAGNLMYGGTTGAAPQTYKTPLFNNYH